MQEPVADGDISRDGKSPDEGERRDGRAGRKRRWVMRAVYGCAGLTGFLVMIVVLMPVISPLFTQMVAARIRKLTGRRTDLKDFSVSLLSTTASLRGLTVREEDGSGEFASVERVEVRFDLLPLLRNSVRLPEVRLSGVEAHVTVDESGRASYQSILDRLGAGKEAEQPAEAGLRELEANVHADDVQVTYENRRSGTRFELSDAVLESKVRSRENVSYTLEEGRARFEAGGEGGTGAATGSPVLSRLSWIPRSRS